MSPAASSPVRLLALHARARGLPAALAGLGAVTLLVLVLDDWLLERAGLGELPPAVTVAVLAALVAAVLAAPGLAGADAALERSTPLAWPRWRAGHLLVVGAVAAAASAAAGTTAVLDGPGVVLRGTAGLLGLTALAAVVLGAHVAWAPATGYAMAAVIVAAAGRDGSAVWAWLVEPAGSRPAALTAAVLAGAGCLAYAVRGARPAD